MTAANWEVGPLGPPTPPSPEAGDQSADPTATSADAAAALPTGWNEADVAALREIVRGPYDKIAEVTNDPAFKLSTVDELMLVATLTTWMPVSWVRAGAHGQLPLIVAIPLTVGILAIVNGPKVIHWNRTHPDAAIAIPFISPKGARRADRPRPTPSDAAGGGTGIERDGGPGDSVEDPAAAAGKPSPTAPVDGGPPADSIADIRRGYARH